MTLTDTSSALGELYGVPVSEMAVAFRNAGDGLNRCRRRLPALVPHRGGATSGPASPSWSERPPFLHADLGELLPLWEAFEPAPKPDLNAPGVFVCRRGGR